MISSDTDSVPCQCRTDARSLMIPALGLEGYPELQGLTPGEDWQLHPALAAVRVEVGSGSRWSGMAEVAAFLRTELDAERYAGSSARRSGR